MKRILLVQSFIFLALLSNSQESKFYVGGSVGARFSSQWMGSGFSNFSDSPIKNSSVSASPLFGYQFGEKNMIGFSMETTYTKTSYKPSFSLATSFISEQKSYVFSPFYRNYLNPSLFTQVQINVGWSKSFSTNTSWEGSSSYTQKFSILGLGIGVGYDIELGERILLEPLVRYNINRHNNTTQGEVDLLVSDVFFYLGLIYRF